MKQYCTENSKVHINVFQRSLVKHFLITQPQIPSLSITSSSLSFALTKTTLVQDASIHPVLSHPVYPQPAITC